MYILSLGCNVLKMDPVIFFYRSRPLLWWRSQRKLKQVEKSLHQVFYSYLVSFMYFIYLKSKILICTQMKMWFHLQCPFKDRAIVGVDQVVQAVLAVILDLLLVVSLFCFFFLIVFFHLKL